MNYLFRLLMLAALVSGLAPAQRMIIFKRAPAVAAATFPTESSRWEMDIVTTTVADQVGSNDCTAVNSPTDTTEGIDFESSSSQYLDCGDIYDADFTTTPISMCGAVSMESVSGIMAIGAKYQTSPSSTGYNLLYWESTDKWFGTVRAGGQILFAFSTPTYTSTATWYHVCVGFDTSPTRAETVMTVNGSAVALDTSNDTFTTATASTPGSAFLIGAYVSNAPTSFWDGQIAVFRIWHGTKLSEAQFNAVCAADEDILNGRSVTPSWGCN